MQDNSNSPQKFLIDAEIGDDDVTLPSLPSVDVPIIETSRVEQAQQAEQAKAVESAKVVEPAQPIQPEPVKPVAEQTITPNQTTTASAEVSPQIPVADNNADTAESSGGFFSRMKQGLAKSRKNLADGMVNILIGGKEIDDELLEEVEDQLLVADIGVDATKTIIQNLTERTARGDLIYSHSLYKALQEELVNLLAPRVKPLHIDPNKSPYVILVVGVNGVGKTTTIGKLAKRLQGEGKKVMLAAGDTFRAAATEQLQIWGERNQIPVVAQGHGSDSASVIYDAIASARAKNIDVLIADTAGRLHNKSNLMEELSKVKRVMQKIDATAPHEIMLVVDAGTGQNAINQVQMFDEAVGLTGLTITKLDGTAKGGVLFNIASKTHVPIRYIGVGEKIDDLRPFSAKSFVAALFQTDE
ncbi:signal recognition particle-docking protein FtsY [Acinetobacter marinus]|uniref:Signal recognition particle receptor FtsY n=1 Tax=Acinetobacter marinus TaxID=281375 RepID=A0A1G6GUG9_9GAMM|nr:signal recognition particle-docking protein FtsY [Acinetobacter marinus]SDB85662.1 signal recognition particle-docking protein FtsY [Acinetobacter marinus]